MYKVNLINPPSAPGTVANREGAAGMGVVYPYPDAFFYPPQTLATVAASLRDAGYTVQAFDAVVEELAAHAMQADVIGIFVAYASLDNDLAFIRALRKQTAAILIAFGPAVRFVAEEMLSLVPVDIVLVGEAEGFFVAALQHLRTHVESHIPRMLTAESVGASCCDALGFVQNLDALPFPAWDLLPYEKYRFLTVLSSRGCPDRCAYCPYAAAQGHRFRPRSVENVLTELDWLSRRFHPVRLIFRDPVFAHDRERVVAICEGMLRLDLRLNWECESRPEHFDADLLRLMQRAGCQWVKIGLETTNALLLQQLRRVSSAEEATAYLSHIAEVVRVCREIELPCRLFVMAGLPGQDISMAQHTRHFIEQLRPAALNVKVFERYPGIDLEGEPDKNDEAQLAILRQAQAALVRDQPGLTLLVRGKRWLRRTLRR
nr:radical SAM protein [Chloroflexota bacterium]